MPPVRHMAGSRRSSARNRYLPQWAQLLRQHRRDVEALLGNELAQGADNRFDDGLAHLGFDVGKGGKGKLAEPSQVPFPRPRGPERLGEHTEVGGQVGEDVPALALGQDGGKRRKDRPGARSLRTLGCSSTVSRVQDPRRARRRGLGVRLPPTAANPRGEDQHAGAT